MFGRFLVLDPSLWKEGKRPGRRPGTPKSRLSADGGRQEDGKSPWGGALNGNPRMPVREGAARNRSNLFAGDSS